ncbi:hypothetical protein GCM10007160_18090 [Litchfieldella qijiaojingensis]|uniref:Winged helix-turn-helix domain-containing protein n=1 Tax=Litchfieldella qijiaojingensis TaxID=980347 RepID=A0ABQ2YQV0_9GAMM|nr:helix-turn-helix domain-containing protein [Halomonas qijiaojingensis]GGX91006.1 hypothetical protein GCM10007160_18090 [Halomonas qijiaojingensis]
MATQVETIRRQLLAGNTLTQRSALMDFGIMALPRRITDLKETGFPVKVEMKSNPMTGQRFAQYSLDDEIKLVTRLKPGCIYHIYDVVKHPFNKDVFKESHGYFTMEGFSLSGSMVRIKMAGVDQYFKPNRLHSGQFKIKYIGGL